MKRIIINHISGNDKSSILSGNRSWNVAMGNGLTLRFKNEVHAKSFLVKASEELSFQLIIMNEIYMDIFTEFRRNWFYFNLTQELLSSERNIKNAFDLFERQTHLAVSRCELANGNHFVFRYLYQSCKALMEVTEILSNFHVYRRNFSHAKILSVQKGRLEMCLLAIDNIGLDPIPDGCEIEGYTASKKAKILELSEILQD